MREVTTAIDTIINTLTEVQKEYTKLEKNLYNTQLQFDFGELNGDTKTSSKINR